MADEDPKNGETERESPPEALAFKQFDTTGATNPTLWRFGIEDLERLPFAGASLWSPIGPAPLLIQNDQIFQGIGPNSGEVVDIAIDSTGGDSVTLYIATSNGGVWKSVNGGASWLPLTDFLPSSAIGAVAIDPGDPNIIYAGSGGLFIEGGFGMPKSVGLFRSNDGGTTWAHLDGGLHASIFANRGINRIVCPAPGALLVGSDAGLFFSKNGGLTFGANHPDYNDGRPIRRGFISALIGDSGATTVRRITDATSTPIILTAQDHGFKTGDRVYVGQVEPTRSANGSWLVDVDAGNADTLTLRNSLGMGAGATRGFVIGPGHPNTLTVQAADRVAPGNLVVIQANGHGFITRDIVAIHGVEGNTAATGSWQIRVRDADHFELVGSHGNAAYTGNGIVDGPRHRAPLAITAAVNQGGVVLTVNGHGFANGDQVTLNGLPGINAPKNVGFAIRVDDNNFRVGGMTLNAAYAGGGTVAGPADAWSTAYFASAGPTEPDRGLYRLALCSDGGVVLSDNLMTHRGAPGTFGRIAVAQSLLPRSRTLYISVQRGQTFVGLFRSDNFGASWTPRNQLATRVATDGGGQSAFDLTIGVDPQDSTRVFAALQQLWRSTDSGATWNTVTAATLGGNQADALLPGAFTARGHSPSTCLLHWDHHELVFSPPTQWPPPADPDRPISTAYFGTDGGIARSDDGGATYVSLNEGLATALLDDMDIGRGANNAVTYGGMQDLGTAGHRSDDADGTWVAGIDSDGNYTAVDPADGKTVLGFNANKLMWTPNGGESWFVEGFPARPVITEVRNTNPVGVATTGHPFQTGDTVTVQGVTGGGGIANGAATVTRVDNFVLQLNGKNGTAVAAFNPGPRITGGRCLPSRRITGVGGTAPIQITTSGAHGFATGDQVRIDGVLGRTVANNSDTTPFWTITRISDTQFSLDGTDATVAPPYLLGTGRVRGPRRVEAVPIQLVINTAPIVVTVFGHGFVNGDAVTVTGTNNANTGPPNPGSWVITVIDANSVILRGSAGHGPVEVGPRASGALAGSVGRGLGAPDPFWIQRVSFVPNGAQPATTAFVSRGTRLFSSANGGRTFTAVTGSPAGIGNITAIASPDTNQLWVGTAARAGTPFRPGNVLFRGGSPAHFFGPADNFVRDVGARGTISAVAVDPRNNLRVAVVTSGFSETSVRRRTLHCFLTTTGGCTVAGGRAWTEVGGAFDAPNGNLPDFPVLSVAWDNSTDPSTLLVASEAGVLRLNGNAWERVGPNLPNASCQALRIDSTVNPPVIRVGTYGRSAWEWTRPTGPRLIARAQLGFGERRVGQDARLPVVLHNVGDAKVTITKMDPVGDFSFDPVPALSLDIDPGGRQPFNVLLRPSSEGLRKVLLQVESNDPDHPLLQLMASGVGVTAGIPRLSVRARVDFGFVAVGDTVTVPLEVANTGLDTLNLTQLQLAAGNAAFSLVGVPV